MAPRTDEPDAHVGMGPGAAHHLDHASLPLGVGCARRALGGERGPTMRASSGADW